MNDIDEFLIPLDVTIPLENCITQIMPTDHTVRPATGKIREHLSRVRDEIAQLEAWKVEQERNGKIPPPPLPSIESLKRRKKKSQDDNSDFELIPDEVPLEEEQPPWADGM